MDHLDRKSLKLDQLRMIILDEADRMLDMGFAKTSRRSSSRRRLNGKRSSFPPPCRSRSPS
jgi:superfamily II DNA/RNA helicase